MQKLSSSLTIEFIRDFLFTNLTFKGFLTSTTLVPFVWSICSYPQVSIRATWNLQLIDDFSTSLVGAICGKWVISYIAIQGLRVVWSWHDWWPLKTKRLGTRPTYWKGRCKPSPQRLNGSLNGTTSWNDSWSSRIIRSQTIKMTNRAGMNVTTIVPRWMITKNGTNKRSAMPLVDETNKIPVAPLSWNSAHYAWCKRCKRWRRIWMMMSALKGQVSTSLDELVHRIDSPFTTPITSFPFPAKFRMP